jgi:hypothetical protein
LILAFDVAGARAGLEQQAGRLLLLGSVGRLAGERQAGGRILALGPHRGEAAGHGHRAGFLGFDPRDLDAADRRVIDRCEPILTARLPAEAHARLDLALGRSRPPGAPSARTP